jgi:putative ABC transport system substrate-binding protein
MAIRRFIIGFMIGIALLIPAAMADQPPRIAKVGVLVSSISSTELQRWLMPLKQTLREHGLVEGKTIQFEYREPSGQPAGFAQPVAELVKLKVDALFCIGAAAVRAAVQSAPDIPIVAHDLVTEPVAAGYARSYARPGGNLTGVFLDTPQLAGKWLELLKAMMPDLSSAVALWDSASGPVPVEALEAVAHPFGVKLQVLSIRNSNDIDKAPSSFAGKPQALIIFTSPILFMESQRLARLATKQRLPATAAWARFAEGGGLLSYGPETVTTATRCAELLAKILSGARAGDLPIKQPTKFDLVVNLKSALGGTGKRSPAAVEFLCLFEESSTMDTELEKLEAEALKLAPGERAALAQRLLASLEEDTEIEEAWAQEVERRIAEVESGAVQLIPIEEALARVRAALK